MKSDQNSRIGEPTLDHLREGEQGVLERIEVEGAMAGRLMDLGFLPGSTVVAGKAAPGGDPRVFRVDGADVAIRRETAARLYLRKAS